jgi:peptidyl-prolyl cis-trans isomerase SurA
MKTRVINCIVLLLFISANSFSNDKTKDPVVITIDKQDITKSEFLRIYSKNNSQNSNQENNNYKSVKDYLDMFINYKLKVIEAENIKLDTVNSFITEYESYRDQLAKPYLTDSITEANLMKDLYNRMITDLELKQIFVKMTNPDQSDSAATYTKAISIRNEIIKGGVWDSIVTKNSDDPNAKKNFGKIGFINANQQIPYIIEQAIYSLKKGEVTMPIKLNNGYYLISLSSTRPSVGEIKVAHIMTIFPENSNKSDSAKIKIDELYKKLKNGAKFEDVATQFSEDKRSAKNGGELNWFGAGQMVPEFENAAFALNNNGDHTEPIKTSYGWHIIKRLDRRTVATFEDSKEKIKQRISRDDRSQLGKQALIKKIKKEVNAKEYTENLKLIYPIIDSVFLKGNWTPKGSKIENEPLLTFANQKQTVKEYLSFLSNGIKSQKPKDVKTFVKTKFDEFVDTKIIEFEKSRLPNKFPEFKFLTQEYHDGILLFNLMEQKIWSVASTDTTGLKEYFNANRSKYKWSDRIEGIKVGSKDKNTISKALNIATANNKIKNRDLTNQVCENDSSKTCISTFLFIYEKGDNSEIDSLGWKLGVSEILEKDGQYTFYLIRNTIHSGLKELSEAKGLVIADYQTYLEEKFIANLRKKYTIKVNEKELESIDSKSTSK